MLEDGMRMPLDGKDVSWSEMSHDDVICLGESCSELENTWMGWCHVMKMRRYPWMDGAEP